MSVERDEAHDVLYGVDINYWVLGAGPRERSLLGRLRDAWRAFQGREERLETIILTPPDALALAQEIDAAADH